MQWHSIGLLSTRILAVSAPLSVADTAPSVDIPAVSTWSARDSLDPAKDSNPDAQACIDLLSWPSGEFTVQSTPAGDQPYDALVSFPSPLVSGNPVNDR